VKTYVAFVRAINVAGHAVVRMTDLKEAFATAGCKDVRTYVTFLSEKPERPPKFPLRSSREALDAIGMKHLEVFVVSRDD
jgi:hypothetical protein